jgi:hypothetical protein
VREEGAFCGRATAGAVEASRTVVSGGGAGAAACGGGAATCAGAAGGAGAISAGGITAMGAAGATEDADGWEANSPLWCLEAMM